MSAPAAAKERVPLKLGAAIGAGIGLVLALLELAGVFRPLDLRLHDWRYRLRGAQPASQRIALVEIDDPTVAAYKGVWPLPRQTYAVLIDALENSRAQAVGFDLLFLGENADDGQGDELLATLSKGRDNIVHAISFLPEDATLGGGGSTPSASNPALIRHGRPVTHQRLAVARQVSLPYERLLENADALGHTAVAIDPDGTIRRIPQFVRYGDWAYPSLALRLVESAARKDPTLPQFELADDGVRIFWNGRHAKVPTDDEGTTAIAFAGDRAAFPNRYSMLQVLQWYRDGDSTALARAFKDKLVLIGVTAVEQVATDIGATPYAEAAPLIYVHANAVNAALQGRFLARVSPWAMAALVILLGLALGMLFSRLPLGRAAAVAIGAVAIVGGADFAAFALADVDAPPTAALFAPLLTWIAIEGVWRTAAERRARERERELQVARSIQQHLLPAGPPTDEQFDIFGANLPADAIGGDYYDWIAVDDDTLAVVVGDVSGHGVPAALLMAHLRASLHAEARPGSSASEIVGAINRSLARAAAPGKFATFFLALISRREEKLTFCNAGHNPPLLVRDGKLDLLAATGIPLGMMEGLPYSGGEREFRAGDTLVLYSDGIPEAPLHKEFYGDERLLAQVLAKAGTGAAAAELGNAVLDDVRAFAGDGIATDDVTIVVVRRR